MTSYAQSQDTSSAIRTMGVTGSHQFKVFGYSLIKGIGSGKWFSSDVFTVAGYKWMIRYYPGGQTEEDKNFMSVFLHLKSDCSDVKVRLKFCILQQDGVASVISKFSDIIAFKSETTYSWGYKQFVKTNEFEASNCLIDDAFTLKCTVTVVQDTKLEVISPGGVTVPPSNLSRSWVDLLESSKGADITFVVKGERFKAHRGVLAIRSAVFNAMLFGGMKETGTDTVTIDDIEAPVFDSLLHFIYSDSLPNFGGKQDMSLFALHLLVAADRFELERLRLMCEDLLCKNLDVSNAATALITAEQHNCSQLKAQCLKFMSSAEVFKEVAVTPEYQNLMKICPSVLKDIKALKLHW